MQIFAVIVTLFVVGSLFGWILEVFYRRFVSQKRWMNPGFLTGPYLPIYGFGVLAMYALSELVSSINITTIPSWAVVIITILVIGVVIITIEFIAGLIFIKGLGLKLWDYSDRWGNTMGIICPLYDVLWVSAGSIYYFFIHQYLRDGVIWISEQSHNVYYLFVGIVLGMIIVDFAYSAHIASAITKFAKTNQVVVKLSEIQLKIKNDLKEKTKKRKFFIFPSVKEISDNLKDKFDKNKSS